MIGAIIYTIIAWFIGMFLDVNIGLDPIGFLELRTLFPIIVMGWSILKRLDKRDS